MSVQWSDRRPPSQRRALRALGRVCERIASSLPQGDESAGEGLVASTAASPSPESSGSGGGALAAFSPDPVSGGAS